MVVRKYSLGEGSLFHTMQEGIVATLVRSMMQDGGRGLFHAVLYSRAGTGLTGGVR